MRELPVRLNEITLNSATTDTIGPPLVMLHGVTRRWQTFVPVIPALQLQVNIRGLDFRGHGLSSRVAGRYAVMDYVGDTADFVEQQFRTEVFTSPIVLYGHSLGAMVAAGAAVRLGDRVRAVVMEDPPLHTMGERISQNILHSFFKGMQPFAGSGRAVSKLASDLAEVRLINPENQQVTRLGDIRDVTALRFTAASLKLVDPDVFAPIIAGDWLRGYDVEHVFRSLKCPALLLQADMKVGGMLTDEDAEAAQTWAADLSLLRFPGVGHVIHVAQTAQLVNSVHSFLESVR